RARGWAAPEKRPHRARWMPEQRECPVDHRIGAEAVFAHHHGAGRGSAEAIHADHVAALADVAPPALRYTGFEREARVNRARQHAFAVLRGLRVEELEARHRHDAGVDL